MFRNYRSIQRPQVINVTAHSVANQSRALSSGKSIEKNCDVGIKHYGGFTEGFKTYLQDYPMAKKYFTISADNGFAEAQYLLARMNYGGECGETNDSEARRLLTLASAQNHGRAQHMLGMMCRLGEGGEKDLIQARELFRSAAIQGFADSQYIFAEMCWKGEGGERDDVQARKWFIKAANQGVIQAQYYVGMMYSRGEGGERDDVQARKWFMQVAGIGVESGVAKGMMTATVQYELGMMWRMGRGGDKNEALAQQYFTLAAEQGQSDAQCQLDLLLEEQRKKNQHLALVKQQIQFLEKNNNQSAIEPQRKCETKKAAEGLTKTQRKNLARNSMQPEAEIIPPKTLFCNALQINIKELIKIRSKIEEIRKLQETIVQDIKTSSDKLVKPLNGDAANKARLLGLESNLRDVKELEKNVNVIKKQEKIINSFLELLRGLQGELTAEENLKLQERLTSADDKEESEFISIFTIEKFLALREALSENEDINDEVFESGLIVLKEKWDLLLVPADKIVLTYGSNLRRLSIIMQERVKKHLVFVACEVESEPFLAKVPAIKDTAKQIQLKVAQLSTTNEGKTAQDWVEQHAQKTSASQGLGNERGESGRRVTPEASEQALCPADRGLREENASLSPKKLSTAARKAAYEAGRAAKVARIAYYKQKQAAKRTKALQEEQAGARFRKLEEIKAGKEVCFVHKIKTVAGEKTTLERQNPLFKEKTIESHNELQKLKSIIKIIKKTGAWTPEIKYAILQSFAFLNDVVSVQHEHPATKAVAKCLRKAIFKQYKEVMNIVPDAGSLLDMVNAWITFLETPNDMCFFVNERAVLDKVSSAWLSRVYELGEALSREVDIDKSCIAFEEMMRFGHSQRYGTECSIRLILGKIGKFQGSIKAGREIIIMPDEETFIVYYKNRNNCEIVSFHCDEDQRKLLLKLMFNAEELVREPSTEEIYKKIYAAVTSREGCTRFGDDIIGYEAARFYWAITGSERRPLEQASRAGNGRARGLLKQLAPKVFRLEHLQRGILARHFEVLERLEEETKYHSEYASIDEAEPLLFVRDVHSLPCLLNTGNHHRGTFSNNQQASLSPSVVPAVKFVFSDCIREPTANSQPSGQAVSVEYNSGAEDSGLQVKSESPKSNGF